MLLSKCKNKWDMFSNFVAFSENLNFMYIPFFKAFTAMSVDNGDKRCQVLYCKYRSSDASIFQAGPALQGTIIIFRSSLFVMSLSLLTF